MRTPLLLDRALVCVAFLLVAVTWSPLPFLQPAFLAEDGSVFFADILHRGPTSIVQCYALNFHVLERLIAWGAALLPTLWAPAFIAWTSLVLAAWGLSTILDDGYAWLHPSRVVRACAVITMALTPGSNSYGSLCHLPYVFAAWLFILALRKPIRVGPFDLALWFLLSMSTPAVALVFVTVLGLAVVERRKEHARVLAAIAVPLLLLVVEFLWDPFTQGPCHPDDVAAGSAAAASWEVPHGNALAALQVAVERFSIHFFFMPLLGGESTAALMRTSAPFWALSAGCLAFFAWWARTRKQWWFVAAGALGSFSLAVLGRTYALDILLRTKAHTCWDARYAFIPGVLAILLWLHVGSTLAAPSAASTASPRARRIQPLLLAAVSLVVVLNLLTSYHLPFRREDGIEWRDKAARIDAMRARMRDGSLPIPQTTEPIESEPPYWGAFTIRVFHP